MSLCSDLVILGRGVQEKQHTSSVNERHTMYYRHTFNQIPFTVQLNHACLEVVRRLLQDILLSFLILFFRFGAAEISTHQSINEKM